MVAFVNLVEAESTGAASSLLWSKTVASGSDLLLVVIAGVADFPNSPDVTDVTWNSSTITKQDESNPGVANGHRCAADAWTTVPTASTNDVEITCAAGTDAIHGIAADYSGVSAVGATAAAAQTGNSTTVDFTLDTTANDSVVVWYGCNNGETTAITPDDGASTERADTDVNSEMRGAYYDKAVATSGTTQDCGMSGANKEWGAVGIELLNAGGAPAANPKGPFGLPFHGPFGGPV